MSTETHPANSRQWLEDLRTTLTEETERQQARLTELTADTGDPGEAHTRSAMLAATRQSLEQINGALRRIADGRYGDCEKCGRRIPPARLEVVPHARFCVPCQEKQGR